MNKYIIRILILIHLILLIFSETSLAQSVAKSYIIKVNNELAINKISSIINDFSNAHSFAIKAGLSNSLKLSNSKLSSKQDEALDELKRIYTIELDKDELNQLDDLIASGDIQLEPNRIYSINISNTPDDKLFPDQWALHNLSALSAWAIATGKGVVIGVVDTGIDYKHEDLIHQLWINSKEDINQNGTFEPWPDTVDQNGIFGDLNGIDEDQNGYADDVIGYDFVDQQVRNIGDDNLRDPMVIDEQGHGTYVSGVISAEHNNEIGISGLAYESRIMTLRAFDATGNAESDDIAAAIIYGVVNGAKVLNFSFGEPYPSLIMHAAIKFAHAMGVTMVTSSGNNGSPDRAFPSDYDEVINVGASTPDNLRASLSNFGNQIDLLSPGVQILTTVPGNKYAEKSGTSFASPYVSSVIAQLLEINPNLKPNEIKSILQSTSIDIGDQGWDIRNGAGIVSPTTALNFNGTGELFIHSPSNHAQINKSSNNLIVNATIINSLIDKWQLMLGVGEFPSNWELLTESDKNINENKVFEIDLSPLADTIYNLRIVQYLKNNKTIEKRNLFKLFSDKSPLEIVYIAVTPIWQDGKKAVLVSARTNMNCSYKVEFRRAGSSDDYKSVIEYDKYTSNKHVLLNSELVENMDYEGYAIAYLDDSTQDTVDIQFRYSGEFFPQSNFKRKFNKLNLSYLNSGVADLYNNGMASIAVNDLSRGGFGDVRTYTFNNGEFLLDEKFPSVWLPKDIGESNGDGRSELLITNFSRSGIVQSNTEGGSVFDKLIFGDTTYTNFWAAEFYDYDKDGKDEVLVHDDTSFILFKHNGAGYIELARTNYGSQVIVGTSPGWASADFDGDGKIELVHSNLRGHLFVHKFTDNGFELQYQKKDDVSSGSQMIASGDFDGDGNSEIAILNSGSTVTLGINSSGVNIWNLNVIDAKSSQEYEVIASEFFWGVRAGIAYSNGIATGDLNADGKDEIVISVFPNLYVMSFDDRTNKFIPVWNYKNVYSNTAIIYDFDNNGINDLGFSTFGDLRFYEFIKNSDKLATPENFKGVALSRNSVKLTWNEVPNAQGYEIFRFLSEENAIKIGETSDVEFIGIDLPESTIQEFAVRAFNNQLQDKYSDPSLVITIYLHDPISPISAEALSTNEIKVDFSGELSDAPHSIDNFKLLSSENTYLGKPISVIKSSENSVLVRYNSAILINGFYQIQIDSFLDKYGSPIIGGILDIEVDFPSEPTKLILTKVEVLNSTELLIDFSERVTTSAENPANYQLLPGGDIISAIIGDNPVQVRMNINPNKPLGALGRNYTIIAKDINAISGNAITDGAGSSISFVFSTNDLSSPFVYPNPIRLSSNQIATFANITPIAEVEILNLKGSRLRLITETDGNGGVEWDGRDDNGNLLDIGIYLFRVKGKNTDGIEFESELKKFAIVR